MRYDMSRQEMIDRTMCRPGYRWNETLGKCLAAGGGETITRGDAPKDPGETATGAIKQESMKRAQSAPAPKAVK